MTTGEKLTPDRYLEEEVLKSERYYDRKAVRAKGWFLRWRVFSLVGGALVPILANLTLDTTIGDYSLKTLLITVVSLGVVVAVSLDGVFHHGDQWKNFRLAQATLRRERLHFQSGTGRMRD